MYRPFCEVFHIIKRHAGHSKWQNIRHTKELKDKQRSQMFTQFCQRIKVAIQENGNNCNPASNIHLAQAIETAKRNDMPIATIQSCIKSTQLDKDAATPLKFSIRGPRGSILLVSALSKSQRKTKLDVNLALKKIGGIISDTTLEGSFERKGIIITIPPADHKNIEEISIDHAIEAGAEEVSSLDVDKKLTFTCDFSHLHKVKNNLEEKKYTVEDFKITYVPKMVVSLSDDEMELMSKIIQRLEELPEIVEIYDNIQ